MGASACVTPQSCGSTDLRFPTSRGDLLALSGEYKVSNGKDKHQASNDLTSRPIRGGSH